MKHNASSLVFALGALLVLPVGCKDSPLPSPIGPPALRATSVVPASPTAFHAPPGSRVAAPAVVVLDHPWNRVANVPVSFIVVSGGGSVANRVVATDARGRATAGNWVLGGEPGENLVVATVEGLAPVAFMATGGLEPVDAVYGLARIDDRQVPVPGSFIGGYYILYDGGTFRRGYVSGGADRPTSSSVDVGVFSCAGSVIAFDREGYAWTGVLRGDSLFFEDYDDDLWGEEVYALTLPDEFPPVSRSATIYDRQTPNRDGSLSRYVLYEDSTFGLQYTTRAPRFLEYGGTYSRADSVVTFDFDAGTTAAPWEATGTVSGDHLIVEYNFSMIMSDFEDGVYVRAPERRPGPCTSTSRTATTRP